MTYEGIDDLIIIFLRRETNSEMETKPIIYQKDKYDGLWFIMGNILINKNSGIIQEWQYKDNRTENTQYGLKQIYRHIKLLRYYTYKQFMDKMTIVSYTGKTYELTAEMENELRNKI